MKTMKVKKISEGFLVQIILGAHMVVFATFLIIVSIINSEFYFATISTIFLAWLIYYMIYKIQKVDIVDDKILVKTLRGIVSVIEYNQIYRIEYFESPRWRHVAVLYEKDSRKEKFGVNVDTLTWEDIKEFAIFVKSKNNNVDITAFED